MRRPNQSAAAVAAPVAPPVATPLVYPSSSDDGGKQCAALAVSEPRYGGAIVRVSELRARGAPLPSAHIGASSHPQRAMESIFPDNFTPRHAAPIQISVGQQGRPVVVAVDQERRQTCAVVNSYAKRASAAVTAAAKSSRTGKRRRPDTNVDDGEVGEYHWYSKQGKRVLVYNGTTYTGRKAHTMWKQIKQKEKRSKGTAADTPSSRRAKAATAPHRTTVRSAGKGRRSSSASRNAPRITRSRLVEDEADGTPRSRKRKRSAKEVKAESPSSDSCTDETSSLGSFLKDTDSSSASEATPCRPSPPLEYVPPSLRDMYSRYVASDPSQSTLSTLISERTQSAECCDAVDESEEAELWEAIERSKVDMGPKRWTEKTSEVVEISDDEDDVNTTEPTRLVKAVAPLLLLDDAEATPQWLVSDFSDVKLRRPDAVTRILDEDDEEVSLFERAMLRSLEKPSSPKEVVAARPLPAAKPSKAFTIVRSRAFNNNSSTAGTTADGGQVCEPSLQHHSEPTRVTTEAEVAMRYTARDDEPVVDDFVTTAEFVGGFAAQW